MRKSFITLRRGSYLTRLMALLLILTAAPQVNAQVPSKTAQQHQMQLYQDAVKFDVKKFDKTSKGMIFISYLYNDGRFAVKPASERGVFSITMKAQTEKSTVENIVKDLYYEAVNRFDSMDKHELGVAYQDAKDALPEAIRHHVVKPIVPGTTRANDCLANAIPICTGNTYEFAASVVGEAEEGPCYGTLEFAPCPAWYYMKVKTAGDMTIEISSSYEGFGYDVDFTCWGPFDHVVTNPTELTCDKTCYDEDLENGGTCDKSSYSSGYIEYCTLTGTQVGEYYVMVVTNFHESKTNISFSKVEGSGTAETDCDVVEEYTINATSAGNGTVTGSGTFPKGAWATFEATPDEGYRLEKWTEVGSDEPLSFSSPYSIFVESDRNVVAHFTNGTACIISVTTSSDEGGTATGGRNYEIGETCTLTATVNKGYVFGGWQIWQDVKYVFIEDANNPEYTFKVTGSGQYRAYFQKVYKVSIKSNNDEYGYMENYNEADIGDYIDWVEFEDEAMVLEGYWIDCYAYAYDHHHFVGFTENGVYVPPYSSEYYNEVYIEIHKDWNIIANFAIDTHTVNVAANNGLYGTVTGGGTFDYGAEITIHAAAKPHYRFVNWTDSDSKVVSYEASYRFTVEEDISLTANFEIDKCMIVAISSNPTFGTVTGGGEYPYGEKVTLTATVTNPKYHFLGWALASDPTAIVSTANPYGFTATTYAKYVGVFTNEVSVNIEANPSYGGTVAMKDAAGNPIVGEAREEIEIGSTITIEATVSEGYAFAGWYDKNTDNIFSKTQKFTFDAKENLELEARFTDSVIWIRVKKGN